MKKSIRPPENWQDFETLCKKLFGEIWDCSPTIKKNGRLGQTQHGVDIYGQPKGEAGYWGIQCKGKDNNLNSKLTEQEIEVEIKKAFSFKPSLHMFIFATTASKDVDIEEFVRIKNQENCAKGYFKIELFCWQDIADLIEENRNTYNWYITELQFKDKYDVDVTFSSNKGDSNLVPKFLRTIIEYKQKPDQILNSAVKGSPHILAVSKLIGNHQRVMAMSGSFYKTNTNHGWCPIIVSIKNSGNVVLEDWKLSLDFSNQSYAITDFIKDDLTSLSSILQARPTYANQEKRNILYKPLNNLPLIQKDCKSFTCYCIPKFESRTICINWHLLARNFDREGKFIFKVFPDYAIKHTINYVDNANDARIEESISKYVT